VPPPTGRPREQAPTKSPRLRGWYSLACACARVKTSAAPDDLRHRRISLLHAQGKSWAVIGELVGNRSKSVTADSYTHVHGDETELDYAALLE
jgi:integrase